MWCVLSRVPVTEPNAFCIGFRCEGVQSLDRCSCDSVTQPTFSVILGVTLAAVLEQSLGADFPGLCTSYVYSGSDIQDPLLGCGSTLNTICLRGGTTS